MHFFYVIHIYNTLMLNNLLKVFEFYVNNYFKQQQNFCFHIQRNFHHIYIRYMRAIFYPICECTR